MAQDLSKNRLGKGLAALIGDSAPEMAVVERARGTRKVPIEFISASRNNPRKAFGTEELEELAISIRERGVVQPIIVREIDGSDERFEIVAGERRWRASQMAGLHEIPVVIHDLSDMEALEIAIIENVQRSDLNAIEEALGYQELIEKHDYRQQDLADVIGKSRSHVANTIRLLKLPEPVRNYVLSGALSAGHARALVTADDPVSAAEKIVSSGLSVRDTEALMNDEGDDVGARSNSHKKPKDEKISADILALEKRLSESTGLTVKIVHNGNGGHIKIVYKSLEQLDDLCVRLMGSS